MPDRDLRVVTPHASVAEFIHSFCRVVDQQHMLLSLKKRCEPGATVHFAVQLKDGRTVFEGVGRVVDLHVPRGGKTGAKLELLELAPESRTMHVCLMMAKNTAPPRRAQSPTPEAIVVAEPSAPLALEPIVRPLTGAYGPLSSPSATLPSDARHLDHERMLFALLVLLLAFASASFVVGM